MDRFDYQQQLDEQERQQREDWYSRFIEEGLRIQRRTHKLWDQWRDTWPY